MKFVCTTIVAVSFCRESIAGLAPNTHLPEPFAGMGPVHATELLAELTARERIRVAPGACVADMDGGFEGIGQYIEHAFIESFHIAPLCDGRPADTDMTQEDCAPAPVADSVADEVAVCAAGGEFFRCIKTIQSHSGGSPELSLAKERLSEAMRLAIKSIRA